MPIVTDSYLTISKDQLAQVFTEWVKRVGADPAAFANRASSEETGTACAEYIVELIVALFPISVTDRAEGEGALIVTKCVWVPPNFQAC